MKKGFTLIELLAIIVLLGILTMLIVPNMVGISNNTKNKLYTAKVKKIESAAKEWGYDNTDDIGTTETYKTIQTLVDEGYMSADTTKEGSSTKTEVENPVSLVSMNSCRVKITYVNNKVVAKLDTSDKKKCGGLE